MSKVLEAKQSAVEEIKTKLSASASTVIVDYRGLNVGEITDLRKQLRDAGIEFKVYKNSLTRRAVEANGYEGLEGALSKPVLLKVKLLLLKKLKHLQHFHHAKDCYLCFATYFKLQFAVLLSLLKLLLTKKKDKKHNLFYPGETLQTNLG
ncbi:50S ribosomal protein L10 [Listeria monocytogenes]